MIRLQATGLTIAALLLAGCTGVNTTPHVIGTVTIGADLPLSGDDAPDGLPVKAAFDLAVKQAGSVCGAASHRDVCVAVQAVTYDDVSKGIHDPATGSSNVQAMAADSHVVGMIGPLYDSLARSEIPAANAAQLAIISPANTDECLTQEPSDGHCHGLAARLRRHGANTYFRVLTTQLVEGPAAADLAVRILGKRHAFVVNDRTPFGLAVADEFGRRLARDGGSVVKAADLASAKAMGADVVYFAGSDITAAAALRHAIGTQMPATPLIGTDRLASSQFAQAAGVQARGSYYTVPGPYPLGLKRAASFLRDYQHAAGGDPTVTALAAFDATNALIRAIARAIDDAGGTIPNRQQVLRDLAATRDFNGVMGSMGFDAQGDTTLKVVTAFQWMAPGDRSARFTAQLTVD